MEILLSFILSLLMAIAIFFVIYILKRQEGSFAKIVGSILGLIALAPILPMLFIYLFGVWDMLHADPNTMEEIASGTIEAIVSYAGNILPSIVVSELVGIVIGSLVAVFVGKDNQ